jgi:hypothetical protein
MEQTKKLMRAIDGCQTTISQMGAAIQDMKITAARNNQEQWKMISTILSEFKKLKAKVDARD